MSTVVEKAFDPFMHTLGELEQIASDVLKRARDLGASDAVVHVAEGDSLSVTVRMSEIDVMERSRSKALSLTVFAGQQQGSSSSNDFSSEAIQAALDAALHIASFTAADSCSGPLSAAFLETAPPDLQLFHPWDISLDGAISLARKIEIAALAVSPLIANDASANEPDNPTVSSDGASVSAHHGQFFMATSRGFRGGYAQSFHSYSCQIVAANKQGLQSGGWSDTQRASGDLDAPEMIGRIAAQRAVARLNSRRIPTGVWPVLFEAPVAGSLINALISACSGDAQFRRQSFLYDRIGHVVMADHLSIVETPHELRGLASAPFDAEGARTTQRTLVDDGILRGYFLSSYSARKLNLPTTGHAGGPHNLRLSSRLTNVLDELPVMLQKLGTGLMVTAVVGHGINAVTGDYSRGVSGFWVEHGCIQYPVEEITIAGNLKDMFGDISAVGNDTVIQGAICTGSILIDRMGIAGL